MHARNDNTQFCLHCNVRDRALCSALPSSAAAALHGIAQYKQIAAGQVIQSQDHAPAWFATVMSGVIKLVKVQQDGRQQITGLLFPSDFLGHPYAERSSLLAEAATTLELCCFSKGAFAKLMRLHPSLKLALLLRAFDDLDAARQWMLLLGRQSARERVASLLSTIARRLPQSRARRRFLLQFASPLSRTEIADALGLTIETVSREIRDLKSKGLIDTKGRREIFVPDLAALTRIADGNEH